MTGGERHGGDLFGGGERAIAAEAPLHKIRDLRGLEGWLERYRESFDDDDDSDADYYCHRRSRHDEAIIYDLCDTDKMITSRYHHHYNPVDDDDYGRRCYRELSPSQCGGECCNGGDAAIESRAEQRRQRHCQRRRISGALR